MLTIGTRLKNKHTGFEYTICEIIVMDFDLVVYEIATDNMQTLRFNQDYVDNYTVIE
mgnify:FL=1|jgi:hypothetical protein|tara:strand:+ start:2477 stop:2647 length:171 start_codon:yes stop_codon:yes gene_type:complete